MQLNEKRFNLKWWQGEFVNSSLRYPAMVSAWGTGKTLCGILKAMKLSEMYSENLGVIFRKEYTDLRDSTIKDFESYTGLKVSSQRDVVLPNKSTIMFRHLEELNNLQNINLGWFLIEQGEELDTDDNFMTLRGRLRRAGVQHCGMVIANTKGHNWIYKLWKLKSLADSILIEAKTEDNSGNLPATYIADLERLRIEKPRLYNRFVLNSWEEDDISDVIISPELVKKASTTELIIQPPLRKIVSIDVARYGNDKTVMYAIYNNKCLGKREFEKKNTMETVGNSIIFASQFGCESFAVDEIGVGAGVVDRLKELGKEVIPVNSSKRDFDDPSKGDRYYNRRAEFYDYGAKLFQDGNVQILADDEDLKEQLCWAKYKEVKSSGLFQVEAKEDIKERYGRSPDNSDAFLFGLWALQYVKNISKRDDSKSINGWKHGAYVPNRNLEERKVQLVY